MIALYEDQGILRREELKARQDIYLDQYCKTVHTEAIMAIRLGRTVIFPAAMRYQGELARTAQAMQSVGKQIRTSTLDEVTAELHGLQDAVEQLERSLGEIEDCQQDAAGRYCEEIIPLMARVREYADHLEMIVPDDLWALPSYEEILFDK